MELTAVEKEVTEDEEEECPMFLGNKEETRR
jgi:hypothetical protein